jgi:hypothetical protein
MQFTYRILRWTLIQVLDANGRDLKVRNLISKSKFYASDACLRGYFFTKWSFFIKYLSSRGVNQNHNYQKNTFSLAIVFFIVVRQQLLSGVLKLPK